MTVKRRPLGTKKGRSRRRLAAAVPFDIESRPRRRSKPHEETPEYPAADEEDSNSVAGLFESAARVAGDPKFGRRAAKDGDQENAINAVYGKSSTLAKFDEQLRPRWSIVKEERLAEIFGTYVGGEEIFKIDLPSILNVDEWCECEAQLQKSLADKELSRAREIRAEMDWIEDGMSAYPAHSIFGIICKLMVWRRKNGDLLKSGGEEARRHRLAHAAYADLIRLTGFLSVACKEDVDGAVL